MVGTPQPTCWYQEKQNYRFRRVAMIIDSHIHCGVQNVALPLATVKKYLVHAGIERACLFAPVEDIYDRDNPFFIDTPLWRDTRKRANRYLLDIRDANFMAYYFVWNDFDVAELAQGYLALKWHRHDDEPTYEYLSPLCEQLLQLAYARRLPILLEESWENTLYLINRVNGSCPIIIPHLGMLNGGFERLLQQGIWDNEMVYADTALAAPATIKTFIARYGTSRLLFGSDFPFGNPAAELSKISALGLSAKDWELVTSANIQRLLSGGSLPTA